jgi:hypothetical protein
MTKQKKSKVSSKLRKSNKKKKLSVINTKKKIYNKKKRDKNHSKKIKNRKNNKRETNTVIDTNIPKTISEPILLEEQKKEKKSGIMYFTQDTENAVIEYNKETDMEKRNAIYNEKIKYAFEKLVENIFNTFKFTYFETSPQEFQKETVTHLVANIEKYNPGFQSLLLVLK